MSGSLNTTIPANANAAKNHAPGRPRCAISSLIPVAINSPAAAGLLIATGIRLLIAHRGHPGAWFFAAFAFAGIVVFKLPLMLVLLGLAPLSIAAARVESARSS